MLLRKNYDDEVKPPAALNQEDDDMPPLVDVEELVEELLARERKELHAFYLAMLQIADFILKEIAQNEFPARPLRGDFSALFKLMGVAKELRDLLNYFYQGQAIPQNKRREFHRDYLDEVERRKGVEQAFDHTKEDYSLKVLLEKIQELRSFIFIVLPETLRRVISDSRLEKNVALIENLKAYEKFESLEAEFKKIRVMNSEKPVAIHLASTAIAFDSLAKAEEKANKSDIASLETEVESLIKMANTAITELNKMIERPSDAAVLAPLIAERDRILGSIVRSMEELAALHKARQRIVSGNEEHHQTPGVSQSQVVAEPHPLGSQSVSGFRGALTSSFSAASSPVSSDHPQTGTRHADTRKSGPQKRKTV